MSLNPIARHMLEIAEALKANPRARIEVRCLPSDLELVIPMLTAITKLVPTAGLTLIADFYGDRYTE